MQQNRSFFGGVKWAIAARCFFARCAGITGLMLIVFAEAATAQSNTSATEDPVSRAMRSIDAAVDPRASAATVVIEGSKFVSDSSAARKQGQREIAVQSLKKAESVLSELKPTQSSFLLDALSMSIAAERGALEPTTPQASTRYSLRNLSSSSVSRVAFAKLNQYRATLSRILEEEQVPTELLSVAMVESGFNPLALSPKGARGIWQFMPATAVRYGLAVEPGNDHRTHPDRSTRAAARYFRVLYNQFGDWKLALAAYNAGEGRVQRVIDRTGLRNFDEMARRGLLPEETRKYVPAVLAQWARLQNSSSTPERLIPDFSNGGAK
jgi:membrane-bound lytic murein transglycosylase B